MRRYSLSTTEKTLLDAIKYTLFGTKAEFDESADWDEVLREAENQAVSGLVVRCMRPHDDSERGRYRTVVKFVRILSAEEQLVRLFAEHGIPLVILKGTAAAMYYPEPQLRTMGDVDFIVPMAFFSAAEALLLANGFTCTDREHPRHLTFTKDRICYELHRRASYEGLDIETYVADGLAHPDTAEIEGVRFPVFPALANGLVLLAHFRHHLLDMVGLRHLIDWMMYCDRVLDDAFWSAVFKPVAEKLGLTTLAVTLTETCRKYLGLRPSVTWCSGADPALCDSLMRCLFDAGNFGWKHGTGRTVEYVATNFRRRGMLRYMQQKGEENWEAYRKHPGLKPFCGVYQGFRYLRRGLATGRGRVLFTDFARARERVRLLRRLGITEAKKKTDPGVKPGKKP